jgi:hypothetical protein
METNAALDAALAWAAERGIPDAIVIDTTQAPEVLGGGWEQRLLLASAADPNGATLAVVVGEDGRVLEDTPARAARVARAPPPGGNF